MPYNRTNWKYILLVIILAAVAGGAIWHYWSTIKEIDFKKPLAEFISLKQPTCQELRNQIENAFKNANFCEKDSDCKTMELGGQYTEFGCFKFVNVKTDEEAIFKKMATFWKRCSQMIDECASRPAVVCIDKKCVKK